jgi:di/tricarboxylate transporter/CRP-like cAMP-binding protein
VDALLGLPYAAARGFGTCAVGATVSDEHVRLLSQVDLFRGLDRVALAKLAGHLEPVSVPAGATLFRQGDDGDGLYLISRGSFGVYARASAASDEVLLHVMVRGEAVGEIALLTVAQRTATVRADQDGEVLRLPKARFLELIRRDSSVGLAISAALIKRLRVADAMRLGTAAPNPGLTDVETAATFSSGEATQGARPGGEPLHTMLGWRTWAGRRTIGLLLGLAVFVGGWFGVPLPADLGAPGWHVLIALLAVVPVLALEAMPDGVTALLLVAIWVVSGAVPVRVAMSGFSSTTWVLTVAIFAVGAAIASSGLLYRLALWAVGRASTFRGQVLMLGLSGVILSPAVPNATGRMSLVATAVSELTEALGFESDDERAAGLALAALVGYGQMSALFLTSSTIALLAFALLPEASRADLSWGTWVVRAAPLHVVLLIGLLGVVLLGSGRRKDRGSTPRLDRRLALQRAVLGRPSRLELVAALVTLALLLGFATQSVHGVDPAWVTVTAFVLMAAAGAVTIDTLRAINWSTVLLLGMLAGLGEVFTATKLDVWLANVVVGSVGGLASTRLAFVLGLALLCLVFSLVVRWQAAVPIIVVALSPVARSAGIDPWIVAIVALTASNTFFMPYQSTLYMALYSGTGGRLFRHAQARPLSVAYALLVLLGLAISVPYWQALQLL